MPCNYQIITCVKYHTFSSSIFFINKKTISIKSEKIGGKKLICNIKASISFLIKTSDVNSNSSLFIIRIITIECRSAKRLLETGSVRFILILWHILKILLSFYLYILKTKYAYVIIFIPWNKKVQLLKYLHLIDERKSK